MRKWDSVDNEYFVGDTLPKKEKLIQIAEEMKNNYFENNF